MKKSLDFESPIYSVRNGKEIKIESIRVRNHLDFEIETNLGVSSLAQVYKWGSNTSLGDIKQKINYLREYWEKKISSLQYYSDHKAVLGYNFNELGPYTYNLQFTLNGNLIQDFVFDMNRDCIHQYNSIVMNFLEGLENGLRINGRQKHEG